MEKLRAVRTTTFERVPIGFEFLLGSPELKHSQFVFKKVNNKFATCEDYEGNYYFFPEEKVFLIGNGN